MAVSSEATVIINIELQGSEARSEADGLGVSIQRLTEANKQLAKEGKKTSTAYVENRQQISALGREQKAYISIANGAAGSNNQLRAQLSLLTSQYNALSKEERENTVAGKALAIQTRSISEEIKENEQAIGDNRRSVGDYTNSINQSVVGQIPFLNNLTLIKDVFGALNGVMLDAKAAQEANIIATELNTAATEASTVAEAAMTAAIEAKNIAERQAIVANELRAEADRQRTIIELQLVAAEEREAAVLAQLAVEEQAVVAEERLRIATEQQLVATQAELVAVEEARIAAESGLAASTASVAAANNAAASSAKTLNLALTSTPIGALIVLVGSLVTYLGNLDTVTDGTSVIVSNLKAQVNELGRSILTLDFKGLTERMQAAGIQAAILTDEAQSLEDSFLSQSVKSQKAQAEIAKIRVEAMNRTLSPEVRQRLLAQAEQIDADDLASKKKLSDRELQQANLSIAITGNLTKYQQEQLNKRGVEYALYLQNNLTKQGKVTDEQTKALAKAYGDQTQIQQEYTQRSEKRQNLADKIAEQAEQKRETLLQKEQAAQEKIAAEIDKINEDRVKSELATAATLLTARQKEIQDINADIDKRIKLYEKYGQDTENLERERTARLLQLTQKYYEEDSKIIEAAYQKSIDARIATYTTGVDRDNEIRQQKNIRELADIDAQILAISARLAKGEQDKNGVLDALFAERKAVTDKQDADELQLAIDGANTEQERRQLILDKNKQDQQDAFDFEQELALARMDVNAQLLGNYTDLFGGISDLIGKNTIAGKVAFALQKGLAIAEIIINGEQERAAINLATARQIAAASALGIFGIPAIIAATALGAEKNAEITAREVISTGLIAAQTIAGLISGKAKGGIQGYTSDGKGGVLKGYAKKDDTNAYLRSGEAVVVSEAARDPQTRRILSDINVAYGGNPYPGLALGGIYGGSGLQQTNSDITNQVFQQNQLNEAISKIKIYTAITDINAGQNNYAKIVDAGNF